MALYYGRTVNDIAQELSMVCRREKITCSPINLTFRNDTITWPPPILSFWISNLDTNPSDFFHILRNRSPPAQSMGNRFIQPVRFQRISFVRRIKMLSPLDHAPLIDIRRQPIFFSFLNKIKHICHPPVERNWLFRPPVLNDIEVTKRRTKKTSRIRKRNVTNEQHRQPSKFLLFSLNGSKNWRHLH